MTSQNTTNSTEIKPISITEEMRRAYLDYSMSVIVSRALPDLRDGLKPVHRRILFAMHEAGYDWSKPYKKSARVVGDVIGKYHPHGEAAVYEALVRMAQDFSMRAELIDGQGNFGSVDGDPPAAMRYTEVRMQKIARFLLEDLDKNTVEFRDNYDNSEREPTVLPARFPNLLVNGAGGIAVGMATNIAPHNLGEVIDGIIALMDNPDMTVEQMMEIILGPDFPTGGQILGRAGIRSAFSTGRGSIVVRGKVAVETVRKERQALVVTELPYQVNKALMIERIADLVKNKRIEGISDIRDESDREGMRVVIELRRDAISDVVLNQLYHHSTLQSSFSVNMVALNGGRPELLNLMDVLRAFIQFREEVVTRRTRYLLIKARERAHILAGLAIAVANIDEVIQLIRSAADPATARHAMMSRNWPASQVASIIALIDDPNHRILEDGTYKLSEIQARAILDLRLQRLTALGGEEIRSEMDELALKIRDYLDILRSAERIRDIIKTELLEVKEIHASPRKSEIIEGGAEFEEEDLIQREEMVVTVSHNGYIKRVPLSTYRAQRRGGKGRSGMATRGEDFVSSLFVASTHSPLLFFSSFGQVYRFKVWRLPLASPQSLGKAMVNILPLSPGERITSILPLPENQDEIASLQLMFATKSGNVRRNEASDFYSINRAGKIAMKLDEGDSIIGVAYCSDGHDVLLTTASGQCIRFCVSDVRIFKGRDSTGVRGIRLADDDHVISMAILRHSEATAEERVAFRRISNAIRRAGLADESELDTEEGVEDKMVQLSDERYAQMSAEEEFILTVSENGYGKRSSSFEYRITSRGGKGITAMDVSARNGALIAAFPVEETDQIMLVADNGQLIRCPVSGIRVAGRPTQGVTIFNTSGETKVVSVERVSESGDEEEPGPAEGDEGSEPPVS